jgi:hypothetical protein
MEINYRVQKKFKANTVSTECQWDNKFNESMAGTSELHNKELDVLLKAISSFHTEKVTH